VNYDYHLFASIPRTWTVPRIHQVLWYHDAVPYCHTLLLVINVNSIAMNHLSNQMLCILQNGTIWTGTSCCLPGIPHHYTVSQATRMTTWIFIAGINILCRPTIKQKGIASYLYRRLVTTCPWVTRWMSFFITCCVPLIAKAWQVLGLQMEHTASKYGR
jgi:hypothetical protein